MRKTTWQAAQLRGKEYRRWMIRLAGIAFWIALIALLSGATIASELFVACLFGFGTAWILAHDNERLATALKQRDDGTGEDRRGH